MNKEQLKSRKNIIRTCLTLVTVLTILSSVHAQVPSITSVTPSNGAIGSSVTINGSNFDPTPGNNIVYFGAVSATVNSASSSELEVTVPVSTTYERVTVIVNGFVTQSQEPFVVTFEGNNVIDANTFLSPDTKAVGTGPRLIKLGDVDNDGLLDIISITESGSQVSVHRNISSDPGSIELGSQLLFPAHEQLLDAILADFDADGKLDIAACNLAPNTNTHSVLTILRNTSSGPGNISFAAAVDYEFGLADGLNALEAADLDGDGKLDIAVINTSEDEVSVLRNQSTAPGIIDFAPKLDFSTGGSPYGLDVADIDGDNVSDLVVVDRSQNLSIFGNNSTVGALSFQSRVNFSLNGTLTNDVTTGDIDGDGLVDVVVGHTDSNLAIFMNTSTAGSIALSARMDYTIISNKTSMADINGDGKVEVIAAGGSSVNVLPNNSTSGMIDFGSIQSYAIPLAISVSHMDIGDMDADGEPDICAPYAGFPTSGIAVFKNARSENDLLSFSFPEQTGAATIDDVNHTIHIEVVIGTDVSNLIATFVASSTASDVSIGTTSQSSGVTANDFTNPVVYTVVAEDNLVQEWTIEVSVSTSCTPDNVEVNREATGQFYFDGQYLKSTGTYEATFINRFGCDSLVTLNLNILTPGGMTFVDVPSIIEPVRNASSAFADVNNDGVQDLMILGENAGGTHVTNLYINNGLGSFTEKTGQPFIGLDGEPESLAFADVDGDLDLDVITAGFDNTNSSFTALYLNDGTGDFTISSSSVISQVGRASVVFGDFISGGSIDLLISGDTGSSTISEIYENDGTGVFSNPNPVLGGWFPSVDIGYLDTGSELDWVMNSYQTGSLDNTQVYIGNGDGSFVYPAQNYFNAYFGTIRLADVNGDGDKDLFVTGRTSSSGSTSTSIYLNDGNAQFTELSSHGLVGVASGDVEFLDFDLDGDLDVILLGEVSISEPGTYLFENDGTGVFTEFESADFVNLSDGSVSVADIDMDGYPDIYLNGKDESGDTRSIVYKSCLIDNVEVNESVCDSYDFNGITRTVSGTYQASFTNLAGCDSLVTLNLTVQSAEYFENIYTTTSSYEFDGNTLTNTGKYDATFINQWGCDSIVHLSLTFEPDPSTVSSYMWFEPIVESGTPQLSADFDGLTYGAVRMGDIDGDGDLDVAISGAERQNFSSITNMYTRIYRNDGHSNFLEIEDTNIIGRYSGDMQLFDADGDGDLDVLQSGWIENVNPTTTLDLNDGTGKFTTKLNSGLPDLAFGRIGIGDLDNDGDQDVVMTGFDDMVNMVSQVFFNNGNGEFVSDTQSSLHAIQEGGIAIGDLNSDSHLDIVITGNNGANQTFVYLNDGTGVFTEHASANLDPFNVPAVLLDVDQNNTLDVIIKKKVYLNDGAGTFTLDINDPLAPYVNPVITLVDDFNRDGIIDIAFPKKAKTQVLFGDGQGGFDLSEELNGVGNGSAAVGDLNGDGYPEIVSSGVVESANDRVDSDLYVNDGTGKFNRNILNSLAELSYGDAQFADLDGDGDQDLVTCGNAIEAWSIHDDDEETTKLYFNDGLGNFTENSSHPFLQLDGNMELADYDGDGDIDVLLSGYEYNPLSSDPVPYDGVTVMYINDGTGNFTAVTNTGLPEETSFHMMESVDLDNDDDMDLILKARVFINDGTGMFTESHNHDFVGVTRMVLSVSDVNNDSFKDVFINGGGTGNHEGRLYLNDGTGGLYYDTRNSFKTMIGGASDFADIDGDGDQDLFVAGWKNEYSSVYDKASVYFNDGTGLFIEDEYNDIINVADADSEFSDLDGDGDQDLIVSGWDDLDSENISEIYLNNGFGVFRVYEYTPFVDVRGSAIVIADVDDDGGQDVFISGYRHNTESRLYRNTVCKEESKNLVAETCESYYFFGQELTESGNYINISTNACGKEVTTNLGLTILKSSSEEDVEACDNYTWNGVTFNTSGTYQEIFTNAAGCDSTAVLNLTILGHEETDVVTESCDFFEFGGTILTTTGIYEGMFMNTSGCDSLVTLDLTIHEVYDIEVNEEACGSYFFDGQDLTTSGIYESTFQSVTGCDSLVTLDLTVKETNEVDTFIDQCGSYQFGSQLLTSSGTYEELFTNQTGCDSMVTLTYGHLPEPSVEAVLDGVILKANVDDVVTYQWIDCNTNDVIANETSEELIPPYTGSFAVEVSNGVCSTLSNCISFDWILGTSELPEQVNVYPTATSDQLTIDLGKVYQDVVIKLVSLDGSTSMVSAHNSLSQLVLMVDVKAGMYVMHIKGEGLNHLQRIIITD